MSGTIIMDGRGTGERAKVNSEGQVSTAAVVTPLIQHASEKEDAFTVFVGPIALALGVETPVMRLAPTSTTKLFHVDELVVSFNGGDTNHDRTVTIRIYVGMTAPSANNTSVVPTNLRVGSAVTADGAYDIWDEVGTGMTVTTNGTQSHVSIIGQGSTHMELHAAVLVPVGASLGFTMEAEEAGNGAIVMTGFFELED